MPDDNKLAENKLILLYLLKKIDISLSNNDICQFAMERDIIDYITVQQYLNELTNSLFIEAFQENGTTRYKITSSGEKALDLFESRITQWLKTAANEYITNNRNRIHNEYETTSTYALQENGEYYVTCKVCGLYGNPLVEIDVLVPTKDQAQLICANWKKNTSSIITSLFHSLTTIKDSNFKDDDSSK